METPHRIDTTCAVLGDGTLSAATSPGDTRASEVGVSLANQFRDSAVAGAEARLEPVGVDAPDLLASERPSEAWTRETLAPQATTIVQMPDVSRYLVEALHRQPATEAFFTLQKWEGLVLSTTDTAAIVRLTDLIGASPEEEAELPLAEFSLADLPLIRPGVLFYWYIGYFDDPRGRRSRQSLFYVRRQQPWRKDEIAAGVKWAAQALSSLRPT